MKTKTTYLKMVYGGVVFVAIIAAPICEAFNHFGFSSCTTTTTTITTTNTQQQQYSLDGLITKNCPLITTSIHRCNGCSVQHTRPLSLITSSSFQLYAKRTKTDDDDDDDNDDDDDDLTHEDYRLKNNNNRYDYNRQENLQWLKDRFKFTDEQIKQKRHYWTFLTLDNSILVAKADWLQEELSLSKKEMNKIVQGFASILSQLSTSLKPKLDCLKAVFGKTSRKKMVLDYPRVLTLKTEDIQAKIEYLKYRLNLDDSKVKQFIKKFPLILQYNLEDNIKPTFQKLQQRLSLTDAELSKMIGKFPDILALNPDDNIVPKINWFQQRLDLDDSQTKRVILDCPSLLGLKIDKINERLIWLQQRLSLEDEQLSKIVVRFSTILGLNIHDNLAPTIEQIQLLLSLSDAGLSNLILEQPTLLGCNVTTNLAPKIKFYIEAADVGERVVIGFLGRCPRLFTAGEDRLKHRLEEARDIGMKIDTGCLTRMAMYTPKKWAKSVAYQRRKLSNGGSNKDELW